MDVNDLTESSFAGVTTQLQLFGRILMIRAVAIRNMAKYGFLDQPTTNKEMSDKKTSMFHGLPDEFQITDIMCAVQEGSTTRQLNTDAMDKQRNSKQERVDLVKREVLEKATDEFIKCIIYRHM